MATITDCIDEILKQMSPEEIGLIRAILEYGKNVTKELGQSLTDPVTLRKWGTRNYDMSIPENLEFCFQSGFGIADAIAGRSEEYGAQLQYVIDKLLVKALNVSAPLFGKPLQERAGALQRERWITEKLLEAMWDKLPDDAKRELAGQIEELLKRAGVDATKAARAAAGLATGGLTAARAILGFQFHILLAKLSNLLVQAAIGRGIGFAANAIMQRIAGILLGPIGWLITVIFLIPTVLDLLLPRELDKYVPAVFVVGLKRLGLEGEQV